MTAAAFQSLHDYCQQGGYDFELALRTAERDGVPWYVPARGLDQTRVCGGCGAVLWRGQSCDTCKPRRAAS